VNETISVVRPKGSMQAFIVNGRPEATTSSMDMQCQRTLGHLPMLLHPAPRRVFVLGTGTGMTLGATSIHPGVERIVLAESLDVSRGDCADRLERVADALGEPADGTSDGSRAVRAVKRVLRDVGFPTLAEVGVTEDDLPTLVEAATGSQRFFLDIDCHEWTPAEVEQAFRAGLELTDR